MYYEVHLTYMKTNGVTEQTSIVLGFRKIFIVHLQYIMFVMFEQIGSIQSLFS